MPFPVVVVNSFDTATSGITLMNATPEGAIENRNYPRRYYNFNMVITQQFAFNDQTTLQLTDNNSTNKYLLIDRLNKPIVAEELEQYAAMRRCIPCQFDSVTNTIKVIFVKNDGTENEVKGTTYSDSNNHTIEKYELEENNTKHIVEVDKNNLDKDNIIIDANINDVKLVLQLIIENKEYTK